MRDNKVPIGVSSIGLRTTLAIFAVALFVAGTGASQETVLHSFGNGTDGNSPTTGLIQDGAGNLYGTTVGGGIHGYGTVFELTPNGSGGWTETVLHSFNQNGSDGAYPYAGLAFDAAGNLYGTTSNGGIHACDGIIFNCGTVFELSPRQGGGWTETVLHSFNSPGDGYYPYAGLTFDSHGNLYGTTSQGGIHGFGTVFELTPRQGGGWTETVLHSFGNNQDGWYPDAGLIVDGAGNLYGTTSQGGIHSLGAVFELMPNGGGGWMERVLHSFGNGTDGANPAASLVLDSQGNLYVTTLAGGIHTCVNYNCGTVLELSPQQGGGWTERVLHSFNQNGSDGANPVAGLIFDAAGNLYGTALDGGIHTYYGTVFEFSPEQDGNWTERILHSFGNGTDGTQPHAGMIFDTAGHLYGTTTGGGIHNGGTAFQITP
ncbi:MAG: choice-of-anchor tandem repeat GloVer-containing protein [Candidatus Korobacteraceae bacterium]